MGVRPEHVTLGGPLAIPAHVMVVEPTGYETQVIAKLAGQDIVCVFRERLNDRPGDSIALTFEGPLHFFDAQTGKAIDGAADAGSCGSSVCQSCRLSGNRINVAKARVNDAERRGREGFAMKGQRVNRRSLLIGMALAPAVVRAARAAPMTLRLSSSLPNNPQFANGRVYYDNLVKRLAADGLADRIDVQFFPDNQLGQEIDVVNSVSLGVIDLMVTGTSIWANVVPLIGLLDLGYLFESFPQQTKALDAGAAKPLEQALIAGANVHIIGWAYNFGSRSVLCKSPVNAPADLAGKRIRTLPNKIITECLRLMGAAATPMAFGEIYTALQAGVLDGLEHDPPTIVASKFYETAKFYSLTQHNFSALGVFCSGLTLSRMEAPLRDQFLTAAAEAAADTRVRGLEAEKEALESLKQKGVEIIACDREPFRKLAAPQTDEFIKAHPEAKPIIDIVRSTKA